MKLRALQAIALLAVLAVELGCFFPRPEPGRERWEGPRPERDMPR